jgi:predicted MFS family arabinose efflux permease
MDALRSGDGLAHLMAVKNGVLDASGMHQITARLAAELGERVVLCTPVQTIVQDEMRGRVMAFYTMAFLGTAPLGSLLAGFVADHIGPMNTIMVGGAACILGAIVFSVRLPKLRAHVRPIYIERGILAAAEIEGGTKSL